MALLAALTTWSAGDKLTATAINNEFLNLLDALNGSDQDNLKTKYNAADLPTFQLINSHASGYGLQIGDGTNNDLFGVKSTGVIESKVATGTAPFVIASTTAVANLNADLVDGVQGSALAQLAANNTFTGDNTFQGSDEFSGTLTLSGTTSVTGTMTIADTPQADLFLDDTGSSTTARLRADGTSLAIGLDSGGGYGTPFWVSAATVGCEVDLNVVGNLKINGNNQAQIQTLTDGASIAWDADVASCAVVTLGGNRTLENITNANVGATYQLIVKQDGSGGHTLSWGSYYKFSGGAAPTITTTPGATDIITIFVEAATIFYVTAVQNMS